MSGNEEYILGGFDRGSSDSDSELSETWSELGAQIFDNEGPLFSTQYQYNPAADPDGRMDDFKYEHLLDEEIQNNGEESSPSISMDIKVEELILNNEDNSLALADFENRKNPQNHISSSKNQVLQLNLNSQKIPKKMISSNSRLAGSSNFAKKSFQNVVYNSKDKDISAKSSRFSKSYHCDGCKRKFSNLEDYKSHIKVEGMNCQNQKLFLDKTKDTYTTIRSNEKEEQSSVTGSNFSPKISDDNIDQIIEFDVKGQGSEPIDILLYRKRKNADYNRKLRANETEEQRASRLENNRKRKREVIANETEEQRGKRLDNLRKRQRERIASETEEQRATRLENNRKLKVKYRESEMGLLTLETNKNHDHNDGLRNCTRKETHQIQELTCDKCQIDFSKLCYLSRHNKKIHPEIYFENRKHVCETCGKLYRLSSDLRKHKVIHGEKIYSCPFEDCTKSFAINAYVKHHIRRFHSSTRTSGQSQSREKFHSSTNGQPREKVYLCETCGQGFSESRYFNLHKREHLRLLNLRKQAYENKIRSENPSKSDQEVKDILSKFWESKESLDLKSDPETLEEKKARNKLQYIEKIEKNGLQKLNESIEECLERLRKERIDEARKKSEAETPEERTARLVKCRNRFITWRNKNKEEYNKKHREYLAKKFKDKKSEEYTNLLAKNREKWAKKPPEKKAKRLESMKKYQQSKKKLD